MGRKIPDVSVGATPDLPSQVGDLLQAVTHRLRREARHELGSHEVTWAQMRALRALARLGVPTRMSGLADELDIARRSATSLVDELETRGLVARGHDPDDRRAVTVEVTPAGRKLVDDLSDRRQRAAVGLVDELSDADLQMLRDLLARLVEPRGRRPA